MSKRKVLKERNVNVDTTVQNNVKRANPQFSVHFTKMCNIFDCAQRNESFHKKYITEMRSLYGSVTHADFFSLFLSCVRVVLKGSEDNKNGTLAMKFTAEFIASFNLQEGDTDDADDTHPLIIDTFKFLLSTTSPITTIRFRICQFVNLLLDSLGDEAVLDDDICDTIINYMSDKLQDLNASVRIQAIRALQRLQVPDDENDDIIKLYQFHLSHDPSNKVRMSILSAIARTPFTLPAIIDRLQDVDQGVRRQCLLQMASYPVQALSIEQRLSFITCGLNDRSENVQKAAVNILLPQWLQYYQNDYLVLIDALKLDENDEDIERFVTAAKQALLALFPKSKSIAELIQVLALAEETNLENGRYERCIPLSILTIEKAVYWLALIEYLESSDQNECEEKLMEVVCDLSVYCDYLEKFCEKLNESAETMEYWAFLENKYTFKVLLQILLTFDLGDEIGRKRLQQFIADLLTTQKLDESMIQQLLLCAENLMPNHETRLDFIVRLIEQVIKPSNAEIDFSDEGINSLIGRIANQNEKMRLMHLKLLILELREKILTADDGKYSDELAANTKEFIQIIIDNVNAEQEEEDDEDEQHSVVLKRLEKIAKQQEVSDEDILKCLQTCYYTVASKCTSGLTQSMSQLYKDFIRMQMNAEVIPVRNWALKCAVSISMLYEQVALETFDELCSQIYHNQNTCIWMTAISGICEMIALYGLGFFESDSQMENLGLDSQAVNGNTSSDMEKDAENIEKNSVMYLLLHILDVCQDLNVKKCLIIGFGKLVLSGYYTVDIVSRLLLEYFNSTTDPEINQILGIFFETLVCRRQQICLQKALIRSLLVVLESSAGKYEATPDTIVKFIINATLPASCKPNDHLHDKLANDFLKVMLEKSEDKTLLMLLSKEMVTLQISMRPNIRDALVASVDELLNEIRDSKIVKNIKEFKSNLLGDGNQQTGRRRAVRIGNDQNSVNDTAITAADKENTQRLNGSNETEIEPSQIVDVPAIETSSTSNDSNSNELGEIELDVDIDTENVESTPRTVRLLRKSLNVRSNESPFQTPNRTVQQVMTTPNTDSARKHPKTTITSDNIVPINNVSANRRVPKSKISPA